MRRPVQRRARLLLPTVLCLLLAVMAVGWLVGLGLGMPEGVGWVLFVVCLALMFTLFRVLRTLSPLPVRPYTFSIGADVTVRVVAVAALAAASVGFFADRPRLLQAGIGALFVLVGAGGLALLLRAIRPWSPTRSPGGGGRPRAG